MGETTTATETDPGAGGAPPRRRHRTTLLVAVSVTAVAAVAVVGRLGLGGGAGQPPGALPRAGSTVAVTRTTLTERTEVEGELGYGAEIPLPVRATGTVTWLPEPGATAGRGETLLRVDDRPVVLLYGTLPMYRELGRTQAPAATGTPGPETGTDGTETGKGGTGTGAGPGKATAPPPADPAPPAPVPLRGMDVLQFESNLAALGYTGFTVDEEFTAGTERAVRRWQRSLGLPETGRIGLGDVVYASGRVRLGRPGVRPGQPAGENTLSFTGSSRKVTVQASAEEVSWATRGTAVTVTLPDGRTVAGEVAGVGRTASAPEGGQAGAPPTVPVTVTVADQRALGRLESGPVTVAYVGRERAGVLAVPVAALVALAEGGHGLETDDGRFVAARTGLFADGKVEVSGPEVREGLKVRIPK
ncbi:peptidoglycan-binding protein [Streptomyces sp. NPDC058052]|uniref:peptidoglycan-binding domain-containing protein n=1 Tax=Streptomyces sp. NPDC058052 TaxID=3346316 RepID=UPI0036E5A0FC